VQANVALLSAGSVGAVAVLAAIAYGLQTHDGNASAAASVTAPGTPCIGAHADLPG
jgi:hypothetical protein